MKCKECGTVLPCVNKHGICKECDEQLIFCFTECKTPCRGKEEQQIKYEKWQPGFLASLKL